MKQAFLLFLLGSLVLGADECLAQQQKYLGVILGANFANESLDAQPGGISSINRVGILAGLEVERWFNSQWGISMRDLYVQQGHNDDIDQVGMGILYGSTRTGIENIESSSLDLDLLVKKTIYGNNVLRTYAFTGPSLGFILSGKDYLNDTVSNRYGSFYADTTTAVPYSNVLDWSIVFGVGISVKLDSGPMFFLDAGYWYGLTDIYEWYGGAAYTRDIRIAAGILFPLN
jgi:hypothetical protein